MDDWRDTYPTAIGADEAFARFEELSTKIHSVSRPVVIESTAGDLVLMSAAEYRSTMETLHVLSSPTNAQRLFESLEQVRLGQVGEHQLIADED
ncbi:type II toxin-antitoxin system Phd/YefM family antitoxin [Rhodococcus sp. G-MC3]|uniref:type II toxin-antitoxin system Phd/YefM family antitoxin n=1 Tax=Rhodococcus sp. G-MC3 TaxID=3046209 RepID=UPI0024BAA026|nr:type II toxin-antitoxin system Phd/YefM family antitoxin [Rhodococcus sp. G-MC3]MDJ0396044.1 type II toxin-antitoxin system Phd/YefM family antitoxin [Rhodococcus sp. G-MC3]